MNKINMPGQNSCGRGLFVVFAMLAGSSAIAAGAAIAPPHLEIDLDAFDAGKKRIALRNGESLAYIDRSERSGPPVVLRQQRTACNDRQSVEITPTPTQLRHIVKVHAIHTGDQCRKNADHGQTGVVDLALKFCQCLPRRPSSRPSLGL
jgi:hypothetical protein